MKNKKAINIKKLMYDNNGNVRKNGLLHCKDIKEIKKLIEKEAEK